MQNAIENEKNKLMSLLEYYFEFGNTETVQRSCFRVLR